ncbi:hypothetical protein [Paraherbaspirillum soli]|uniref:Uncharacterized protein n=1 Tax=Paraherbaspirillum soli TaxID=631222 RepID=A0ABW0MHE0_9BURK
MKQDLPARVCCTATERLSCLHKPSMQQRPENDFTKGKIMKLPLISAFLIVYILLAASWISYSQLIPLYLPFV